MKNKIYHTYWLLLICFMGHGISMTAQCAVNLEIQGDNNNRVCFGQNIVVKADLTADCPNPNSLTFQWEAGGNISSSQFLSINNITSNLTVSVTVSDNGGLNETDQFTIDVGNNWSVDVALDPNSESLCQGNDIDLEASISGNTFGNVNYNWSNGVVGNGDQATDFNASIGSQTYSVVTTDSEGCSDSDSFTLTVDAAPNITINGATVWCEGDDIILTASPGSNCVWQFPNSTTTQNSCTLSIIDANTSDAGVYTVTVTDANGCTNSKSVTLSVFEEAVPTLNEPANDLCTNSAPWNLMPSPGGGTFTINGNAPGALMSGNFFLPESADTGTYAITYTVDQGSCTGSETINITVDDAPEISFADLPILCLNSEDLDLNQFVIDNPGGTFYDENDDVILFGDLDPEDFGTGNHTIEYRLQQGDCESSEFESILINSAYTITTGATINICEGTAVSLSANASGGGGGDTYSWTPQDFLSNPNSANPQVSPALSNSTSFNIIAEDVNGCTATASQIVNINPQPVVFITMVEGGICEGDQPTLVANLTGGLGTPSFAWNILGQSATAGSDDGLFQTTPIFNNTSFEVTTSFAPSSAGCGPVIAEPFLIVPQEQPAPIIITDDDEICANQLSLFTSTASKTGSTFSWDIFYPTPTIIDTVDLGSQLSVHWGENNTGTATIFVEEKLSNNCFGTDELTISFSENTAPAAADIFLSPINEILIYNDSTSCQYQWGFYDPAANNGQGQLVTDLPNNTFQSYKPEPYDANRTYFCTAWNEDCANSDCSTTAIFRNALAANSQANEEGLKINLYPNPNFGTFTLEVNKLFPNAEHEVQIFTSLGEPFPPQKIFSQEDKIYLEIDTPDKTAGVYYLTLRFKGEVQHVQGFVVHPN